MSLLNAVLQEVDKVTTEDFKKQRDRLLPQIKELTDRIQMLTWDLHENFVDTYFNFTITKSLEQLNYKNRKGNIYSDHDKLIEDIQIFKDNFSGDEEFSNCNEKFNKSLESLRDLCVAVEGKILLTKAKHEFLRNNYSEAILSIKKLLEELNKLKFDGNLTKALSNLQKQSEIQLSLYTAEVSAEWGDIFKWSENKCVHNLTYSLSVQQSDPILIQKILKTLHVTERLNSELNLFSHFFIDNLLHNVIRHNCDIFTEDHIGAIIFNIKIDLNDTHKPNYQTVFNNLTAVFGFLQSTLGSQYNDSFIEVFAQSIRDKFFNKILEDIIRNNLPSCDSSYENYKNLVIELDLFNKFLVDLKFVDADDSPLNKYINNTDCVLYNKKCDKLLSDIRNLLSQSLSYGTLVVGSSMETESESILDVTDKEMLWDFHRPLFLPKCVISQNVKHIMTLIAEHLEESVKLPEKYSNQLVMYIKDIAVMYQCIVPMKFKVNLECCPLDIALFFNNCFYMAHSLLGPPWKTVVPATLADLLTTVLLECIQDLRVLGLEKISLYLQNEKNVITQNIDPNELTPWTYKTYEQFDTAINKAMTLMTDLKISWHNILPTRMYEMSICTLVHALCESMLHRVFANSQPVSEDLVYMLAMRFEDATEQIITLFEEPVEFNKKINVWLKFTKMPQLLKSQLLEIAELWNENKGLSECYTCEEVRQIIKVRFPDNKYRLKILKEVQ